MSDRSPVLPLFVHTYSQWSAMADIRSLVNGTCASITWVTDYSVFVPVWLPWDYPVNRVFWVNGTTQTSTNANFGIFHRNGRRIYSTGATAASGASIPQFVTPATPFVLPAGEYYFACTWSNTTNRAAGSVAFTVPFLSACGVLGQASNASLADPATLVTVNQALYPYCGVTRTVSGF